MGNKYIVLGLLEKLFSPEHSYNIEHGIYLQATTPQQTNIRISTQTETIPVQEITDQTIQKLKRGIQQASTYREAKKVTDSIPRESFVTVDKNGLLQTISFYLKREPKLADEISQSEITALAKKQWINIEAFIRRMNRLAPRDAMPESEISSMKKGLTEDLPKILKQVLDDAAHSIRWTEKDIEQCLDNMNDCEIFNFAKANAAKQTVVKAESPDAAAAQSAQVTEEKTVATIEQKSEQASTGQAKASTWSDTIAASGSAFFHAAGLSAVRTVCRAAIDKVGHVVAEKAPGYKTAINRGKYAAQAVLAPV